MHGVHALATAPCPLASALPSEHVSGRELEQVRAGRFHVYGPGRVRLVPPVDWRRDPLDSHLYRQNLQKLRFLEPLLHAYADAGDVAALRQATALAIDWVRSNPPGGSSTAPDAWVDKIVGDRVELLSWTTRAAACENLLRPGEARDLLRSISAHGHFLAKRANYVPDNHGLFVDLGLLRLARFFPFLGDAEQWSSRASARFVRTLRGRLSQGVWLEHSTTYQFLVIAAAEAYLRVHGPDTAVEGALARMRDAATWFARPDGVTVQLGDSYARRLPPPAPADPHSATFFGAGLYFVRGGGADDGSYLAVADGFHNLTHKHADELSFDLFDRGEPIVTDTGLYDKDPGPARDFTVSSAAHSTLTVDGVDFPITDPAAIYGSGLVASGGGRGWFAVEGTNPLVRREGVRHHRLFLYHPGRALVVCDRLVAPSVHSYTRYLQLAPGVSARSKRQGLIELGGAVHGWASDSLGAAPDSVSIVRGRRDPLAGFTSASFRRLVPRDTVSYTDQAAGETRALAIALGARPLRVTRAEPVGGGWRLRLRARGSPTRDLRVTRDGRKLRVG
jgi:Heparinase II/III-like protein/Heparinase II/III N-terminus